MTKTELAPLELDEELVKTALTKTGGNVTKTAHIFSTSASRFKTWLDEHPDVQAQLITIRTVNTPEVFSADHARIIQAIHDYNGNVAAVAKVFHTTRHLMADFIDQNYDLTDAVLEAKNEKLDMAESALYKRVLAGDSWATCFFLKTQGRTRGYIERGETFNVNVNLDKLSIEQLERLASGEHPSLVLGAAGTTGPETGGATIDAAPTTRPSRARAKTKTTS